jgi:hypothetical protein
MVPLQDIIRIHVKPFRKPIGALDNVATIVKSRPGASDASDRSTVGRRGETGGPADRSVERSTRDPFSTFDISDLNVEKSLGGSWPLKRPKPKQVVGGNLRSMFLVDRTVFGLPYALRRARSLVYGCLKTLTVFKFFDLVHRQVT